MKPRPAAPLPAQPAGVDRPGVGRAAARGGVGDKVTDAEILVPDVLVLGAGAAGLMCAIEAGRRGRRVLVLDQAAKPAEKHRISGGGRCNFTNLHTTPANFLSPNPHYCVSAMRRSRMDKRTVGTQ